PSPRCWSSLQSSRLSSAIGRPDRRRSIRLTPKADTIARRPSETKTRLKPIVSKTATAQRRTPQTAAVSQDTRLPREEITNAADHCAGLFCSRRLLPLAGAPVCGHPGRVRLPPRLRYHVYHRTTDAESAADRAAHAQLCPRDRAA